MQEPTYTQPIWFRDRWRIYVATQPNDGKYFYIHDDHDGGEDDFRYGYCESIEACKQEIHDRFYSGEGK